VTALANDDGADDQDRRSEAIASGARYLLEKSRLRMGILQAVLRAIDQFEAVTTVIRSSEDAMAAQRELMQMLDIDEQEARAVAGMQVLKLARREHQQLVDGYDELASMVADLASLLASPDRIQELIGTERGEYLAGQVTE
jgi:DNA gyrase subunit A